MWSRRSIWNYAFAFFLHRTLFSRKEIYQINFRHMVKVTFACGRLATWTRFSLNLIEIFCKFENQKLSPPIPFFLVFKYWGVFGLIIIRSGFKWNKPHSCNASYFSQDKQFRLISTFLTKIDTPESYVFYFSRSEHGFFTLTLELTEVLEFLSPG